MSRKSKSKVFMTARLLMNLGLSLGLSGFRTYYWTYYSSSLPKLSMAMMSSSDQAAAVLSSKNYWYATTIDNQEGAEKIVNALSGLVLPKSSSLSSSPVDGASDPFLSIQKRDVHSYFWWDDKLDEADETRIEAYADASSFSSSSSSAMNDITDLQRLVEKAISENHSDETPMIIHNHMDGGDSGIVDSNVNNSVLDLKYPCTQIKVNLSIAADNNKSNNAINNNLEKHSKILSSIGRSMVGKRLAGCAQYDDVNKTLFVKTTKDKGVSVRKELTNLLNGKTNNAAGNIFVIGEPEVIEANKDYYLWLQKETATTENASADDL